MTIDATKVGQVTAALMELLDDEPDGSEIGEVMVLAEIRGSDEDGEWTSIRWRCSDPRDWVQRGILHAALDSNRVIDLPDEAE